MHARSVLSKARKTFPDHAQVLRLAAKLEEVEAARKALAAATAIQE